MAESLGDAVLRLSTEDQGLGRGIDEAERKARGLDERFEQLGQTFVRVGGLMTAAVTAPIVGLGTLAARLADTQIQAEAQLETALRLSGASDGAADSMKEFASSLQSVTTVGDEATLQMLQVATNMGLSEEGAKLAAKEAIGLSKAFGIAEQSAIRYTAGLAEGDTTMLNRYIPTLRNVEDEAERVALAHKILGDAFQAATTEARVGLGPLRQLKNELGDFGEELGRIVLDGIRPFIDRLRDVVRALSELSPETKRFIVQAAGIAAAIGPALVALGGFFLILPKIGAAIGAVVAVLTGPVGLVAALGALLLAIKPVRDALKNLVGDFLEIEGKGARLSAAISSITARFHFMVATVLSLVRDGLKPLQSIFPGIGGALLRLQDRIEDANRSGLQAMSDAAGALADALDTTGDSTDDLLEVFDALLDALSGGGQGGVAGGIEQVRLRFIGFAAGVTTLNDMVAEQKRRLDEWADSLADVGTSLGDTEEFLESLEGHWTDMGEEGREQLGLLNATSGKTAEEIERDWEAAMATIQFAFVDAITQIGDLLIEGSEDWEEDIARIGARLGETLVASLVFAVTGNPLLAALGGVIGAVIGDAIGSAIGSVVDSIFGGGSQNAVLNAAGGVGLTFSDALGRQIHELFEEIGDANAAIRLLLADIIEEMGIETIEDLRRFADEAILMLSDLSRGLITAEQFADSFGETFEVLFAAAREMGEEGIEVIRDLADAARASGVGIEEVGDAIRQVRDELLDAVAERNAFIIDQSQAVLAGLDQMFAGVGELTRKEIEFAASAAVTAFNEMIAAGLPLSQALEEVGDLFEQIGERGAELGLDLGDEFSRFAEMMEMLASGPAQELILRIEGMAGAVEALGNLGLLTADQFDEFGDRTRRTFNQLIDQGFTAEEAIALLGPQLQLLNDLQEQYGFELDKSTQKLLEQAEAQGVVTDKGLTMEDILIEGFNRMIGALEVLLEALTGVEHSFAQIGEEATDAAEDVAVSWTLAADSIVADGERARRAWEWVGDRPILPGGGGDRRVLEFGPAAEVEAAAMAQFALHAPADGGAEAARILRDIRGLSREQLSLIRRGQDEAGVVARDRRLEVM